MGETQTTPLDKKRTGIAGLDALTGGGFPAGRPTLVCGTAGSGKTLLGVEFLVRGATEFGEPGVFVAFEETEVELAQNVASLGFDLDALIRRGLLVTDHVHLDANEIQEAGDYDLEGLFLRLGQAIDTIGAKRVVLDTLEVLFASFTNHFLLRAELRRLFRWLKDRGITAVVTAERGDGLLTRNGIEEYVSDCVIALDNRVVDQISTRRLRIVKYRGTAHGMDEYPFLIDRAGFSVLPSSSLGLDHEVFDERVSTGIPRLDGLLGGGYYRGTTVLVSGTAGAGKTNIAGHFVDAACRRGERCAYFGFEESWKQFARNARSIGLDLAQWADAGLLHHFATRPTAYGLETHLAVLHRQVEASGATTVVIDPITNLAFMANPRDCKVMILRLVDFLKQRGITALLTSLTGGEDAPEQTEAAVSSLIDTWLLVRFYEQNGERNRGLYVLKSRGTAHSNQVREMVLSESGVDLVDVVVGREGVLTGSARVAEADRLRDEALAAEQEWERRRIQLERRRQETQARVAALTRELADEEESLRREEAQHRTRARASALASRAAVADREAGPSSAPSAK